MSELRTDVAASERNASSLMQIEDVADLLHVSRSVLAKWRMRGRGPVSLKLVAGFSTVAPRYRIGWKLRSARRRSINVEVGVYEDGRSKIRAAFGVMPLGRA